MQQGKGKNLESLLSAYLDNELPERVREEVEDWLEQDADARQLLDELRATSEMVSALPSAKAPPELLENLREKLERDALIGAEGGRRDLLAPPAGPAWGRLLAVAAVIALAFAGGYFIIVGGDYPGESSDSDALVMQDDDDSQDGTDSEAPATPTLQKRSGEQKGIAVDDETDPGEKKTDTELRISQGASTEDGEQLQRQSDSEAARSSDVTPYFEPNPQFQKAPNVEELDQPALAADVELGDQKMSGSKPGSSTEAPDDIKIAVSEAPEEGTMGKDGMEMQYPSEAESGVADARGRRIAVEDAAVVANWVVVEMVMPQSLAPRRAVAMVADRVSRTERSGAFGLGNTDGASSRTNFRIIPGDRLGMLHDALPRPTGHAETDADKVHSSESSDPQLQADADGTDPAVSIVLLDGVEQPVVSLVDDLRADLDPLSVEVYQPETARGVSIAEMVKRSRDWHASSVAAAPSTRVASAAPSELPSSRPALDYAYHRLMIAESFPSSRPGGSSLFWDGERGVLGGGYGGGGTAETEGGRTPATDPVATDEVADAAPGSEQLAARAARPSTAPENELAEPATELQFSTGSAAATSQPAPDPASVASVERTLAKPAEKTYTIRVLIPQP